MLKKILLLAVFLLLILSLSAAADDTTTTADTSATTQPNTADELFQEQLDASGAGALYDQLSPDTRSLMEKLGVDRFDLSNFTSGKPNDVLNTLLSLVSSESGGVVAAGGVLLGILLLCALMEGMKGTVKEPAMAEMFGVVASLAACGAVVLPVANVIKRVCEAAQSSSVFMLSFVPVYTGVAVAGGQPAVAASYQTVVMFVAELISTVVVTVVLPLLTVSLALSVTGAVTPGVRLDGAGKLLNKSSVWLLGILVTIFVGMLSFQTVIGAAADTVGTRAIKFSLGSFVPVIGTSLGDAFNTVRGCLGLLKSTLGVFGIVAIVVMMLPPLISCILWTFCLSICGAAAEMFELTTLSNLLKAAQSAVKACIGVLLACSLFMIIATTIVAVTASAN